MLDILDEATSGDGCVSFLEASEYIDTSNASKVIPEVQNVKSKNASKLIERAKRRRGIEVCFTLNKN